MAILGRTFSAHAQKLLSMNFWCKFRHHHSIPRPWFLYKVQNFGDFPTFFIYFCILYAENPPYFYFRFLWQCLTAIISHASALTAISLISAKFEVDTTIHCWVIAFLRMIRYVILWPWPLTFWRWTVVIHGESRVQPCHQVWRPYAYSFLSYELLRFPLVTTESAYADTTFIRRIFRENRCARLDSRRVE